MEIVQENIPLNILTDTYKMKTSKGNRKIKSGKGWVRNTLKKIKLIIRLQVDPSRVFLMMLVSSIISFSIVTMNS